MVELPTPSVYIYLYVPYPREKGPMGGVPYIGPRLEGGPIFEISLSQLHAKERPDKYVSDLHYLNSRHCYSNY